MNRILPNQPGWLAVSPNMRREHDQNFAEALRRSPGEESKQAKSRSDHVAEVGNSGKFASPENGRMPTATVELEGGAPGRFAKTGDVSTTLSSGEGEEVGNRTVPMLAGGETDALSIGLLPGQVAWSRIYPEHLVASGYLSVVDTAKSEGSVAAEHIVGDKLENSPNMDTATPVANGEATAMSNAMMSSSDPLPLSRTGLEDQARSAADADIASSPQALDAITLADHVWAERLMRLTRDHDGEATVWLRDYGLKESGLTPLVSRLIQRGRESGLQIGRIVINGREVWCATGSEGD